MTFVNPMVAMNPLATGGPAGSSGSSSSTPNVNPLASLEGNTQTFLQLLVAQLKYQDPMNPMSGTAFMSQTAQMMQASEITQMVQMVKSENAATETSTAASLIGRQVTGKDSTGTSVTGVVSSVSVDPTNGPSLNINGDSIALSSVTEVSPAP